MIERHWPYLHLEMVLKQSIDINDQCMDGFHYVFYNNQNDMDAWAKILIDTGEFETLSDAKAYFNKEILVPGFDPSTHVVFIENNHGEKIATGMVHILKRQDAIYPRLHYISVMKAHQKQGHGRRLTAHLIHLAEQAYPNDPIVLTTQTWSHIAVRMYQSLGFQIEKAKDINHQDVGITHAELLLETIDAQRRYLKGQHRRLVIGIVAPSSKTDQKSLESGKNMLESLGFDVVLAPSCSHPSQNDLAAPDHMRAKDIMDLFEDEKIDLIMAMKGGYGSPRMIDLLDFDVIKKHSKPFIGFSDVTLLLNIIFLKTGIITYHGPMLIGDFTNQFNPTSYRSFLDVVLMKHDTLTISYPMATSLKGGISQGILLGGNLCLIDVMLHMTDVSDYQDVILLIEDVHEHVYRIDRLLQGLRLKGVFGVIKGIIFGTFLLPDGEIQADLQSMIFNLLKPYDFPVLFDVPIGHIKERHTIPIGSQITLDASQKTITIHMT